MDHTDVGVDDRMGNEDNVTLVPIHKTQKNERGSTTTLERENWPGRYGYSWACPSCLK